MAAHGVAIEKAAANFASFSNVVPLSKRTHNRTHAG
jgi:hypothetical protein